MQTHTHIHTHAQNAPLPVLSGHARDYGYFTGEFLANGMKPPADYRKLVALVPQVLY